MEFEVQSCSTVNGNHITSFDGGKLAFNTPRRKVLNMSSGLCSHESWKTSGILCFFFCVFCSKSSVPGFCSSAEVLAVNLMTHHLVLPDVMRQIVDVLGAKNGRFHQ